MGYIEENINAIEEMTITSNEPFRVRNLHDVNSVLKTIKNLNDQISTYKDFAEEEIAKVTKAAPKTIIPTKIDPTRRTPNLSSKAPQTIRPPQIHRNEYPLE